MKWALLLATTLTACCASMVNGPAQQIPVTSSPPHAAIELACPGEEPHHAGYTPATITLNRSDEGCRITLSKFGYREETIRFRRARNAAAAVDVAPLSLLLGTVSAIAWAMSGNDIVEETLREKGGAAWKQVPERVAVELVPRP